MGKLIYVDAGVLFRRYTSIVLVLIALLSFFSTVAAADGFLLQCEENGDDTMTLTVYVDSAPNDVEAYGFDIHYNTDTLYPPDEEGGSVERGDLVQGGNWPMVMSNVLDNDVLRIGGFYSDVGSDGEPLETGDSGSLAVITFAVRADGDYDFSLEDAVDHVETWPVENVCGTDDDDDDQGCDDHKSPTYLVSAKDHTWHNSGNRESVGGSVSADGRYVIFKSWATDLVNKDDNGFADVFLRDFEKNRTKRVNLSSDGEIANASSVYGPKISAGGRFVVFDSWATNLVPETADMDPSSHLYIRDLQIGKTELVDVSPDGAPGNGGLFNPPAVSPDGRYVAFLSGASNLVANDSNGERDAFLRDRVTGVNEIVNIADDGSRLDVGFCVDVSADGRYVVFDAYTGSTGTHIAAYLRDRVEGTTELIGLSSEEVPANGRCDWPTITADGRFVSFSSSATNLISNDGNNARDIFVRDRQEGTTELVSLSSDGVQANGGCGQQTAISADGRFVAFTSNATNLAPEDEDDTIDVFVRDREQGTTEVVSLSSLDVKANAYCDNPFISTDGRFVGFSTAAANLKCQDKNGVTDVFLRDRGEENASTFSSSGGGHDSSSTAPFGCFLNTVLD